MGEVYPHRERPDREHLMRVDPSESVRSDEILALVEERFEVLYRADLGGALLQPLLYDLVQNFDDDDPYDAALLRTLCALEGLLVDHGALAPDYVFLVARPRGAHRRRRERRHGVESPQPRREGPNADLPRRGRPPGVASSDAVIEALEPHRHPESRVRLGDLDRELAARPRTRDRGRGAAVGRQLVASSPRASLSPRRGRVRRAALRLGRGVVRSLRRGVRHRRGVERRSASARSPRTTARRAPSRRAPGGPGVPGRRTRCARRGADAAARARSRRRGAPLPSPERAPRDVVGEIAAILGRDGGALVEVLPGSGTVLEPLLDDAPPALLALRSAEAWPATMRSCRSSAGPRIAWFARAWSHRATWWRSRVADARSRARDGAAYRSGASFAHIGADSGERACSGARLLRRPRRRTPRAAARAAARCRSARRAR